MLWLKRHGLQKLAGAAILSLTIGAARAEALELTPLAVVLDAQELIGKLVLRNDTSREAAYELTGYDWSQDDGRDIHDPKTDLVVTPPIVSLEPGESVIVRVGLLAPPEKAEHEQGYRIRIRDISRSPDSGSPLRVRTQVLLPVFVRPAEIVEQLRVVEKRGADGRRCLAISNQGSTHQKLVFVESQDGEAKPAGVQQYVLAGETVQVCSQQLDGELSGRRLKAGFVSVYSNKVEYHDVSVGIANAQASAAR